MQGGGAASSGGAAPSGGAASSGAPMTTSPPGGGGQLLRLRNEFPPQLARMLSVPAGRTLLDDGREEPLKEEAVEPRMAQVLWNAMQHSDLWKRLCRIDQMWQSERKPLSWFGALPVRRGAEDQATSPGSNFRDYGNWSYAFIVALLRLSAERLGMAGDIAGWSGQVREAHEFKSSVPNLSRLMSMTNDMKAQERAGDLIEALLAEHLKPLSTPAWEQDAWSLNMFSPRENAICRLIALALCAEDWARVAEAPHTNPILAAQELFADVRPHLDKIASWSGVDNREAVGWRPRSYAAASARKDRDKRRAKAHKAKRVRAGQSTASSSAVQVTPPMGGGDQIAASSGTGGGTSPQGGGATPQGGDGAVAAVAGSSTFAERREAARLRLNAPSDVETEPDWGGRDASSDSYVG